MGAGEPMDVPGRGVALDCDWLGFGAGFWTEGVFGCTARTAMAATTGSGVSVSAAGAVGFFSDAGLADAGLAADLGGVVFETKATMAADAVETTEAGWVSERAVEVAVVLDLKWAWADEAGAGRSFPLAAGVNSACFELRTSANCC